MDALSQALANAAANAPKGEKLYLENLDSIADPTQDEPVEVYQYDPKANSRDTGASYTYKPPHLKYKPEDVAFRQPIHPDHTDVSYISIDSKLNDLTSSVEGIHQRLTNLFDDINEISTTINAAAKSMPSTPDLKHRSLHEWDDTQLINELVERENDLMPFYFELLKRIPQNLQGHVDESMKGKYHSLSVLSKLCAALSYVQPAPSQSQVDVNTELAKLAAMNADERQAFVDKMNNSPFKPYTVIPPTQY